MKVRPSIIIIKNNTILLMKYNYNGNIFYCIPGGNSENMETCKQTICRELNEELNIEIQLLDLAFIAESINKENTLIVLHSVFIGRIISGEPKIKHEYTSAIDFTWVHIMNLKNIVLYPNIGGNIISKYANSVSSEIYVGKVTQKWFDL